MQVIKVKTTEEIRTKVDELVKGLPIAWSNTVLPSEPYALVNEHCTFKSGLRWIDLTLVKNIYDDTKVEKYHITLAD